MIDLLKRHLVKEEGLRLEPYKDSEGYWTIGIGHLIDGRKGGSIPIGVHSFPITEQQAYQILNDDIHKIHYALEQKLYFWDSLSKVHQVCLLSMAFQMGVDGLLRFKKMLWAIENGDFNKAFEEALQSDWATQTSGRAIRIAKAIRDCEEYWLI